MNISKNIVIKCDGDIVTVPDLVTLYILITHFLFRNASYFKILIIGVVVSLIYGMERLIIIKLTQKVITVMLMQLEEEKNLLALGSKLTKDNHFVME